MSAALNIAARALTTNLAALQVVGNNIANVNTEGYSRQNVLLRTSGYQEFGNGFFGKGVEITTVTRNHDAYLTREATLAKSAAAADGTRLSKLKQLEDLFPTGTTGLGASMNSMLNAWNDVASSPSNLTARMVVIARGDEFAARLRNTAAQLDQQQQGTVMQVEQTVQSINLIAKDLAAVNQRILETRGSSNTPNDLLDQRDQLLSDLNQYVRTSNVRSEGGTVSVFVGGGQPLVLGQTANQLSVVEDPNDPSQKSLSFTQGGTSTPLDYKQLGGGELAGLMTYLRQDLPAMQNQTGRMALVLATTINQQHLLGEDLDGLTGTNFFVPPAATSGVAAPTNTGGVTGSSATVSDATKLRASDYEIRFTSATTGNVTRLSDGQSTAFTSVPATEDGLSFAFTGAAASGDRFMFRPYANAAKNLEMALASPDKLAAASPVTAQAGAANSNGLSVEGLSAVSASPTLNNTVTITFGAGNSYNAFDTVTSANTPGTYTPGQPISVNGWSLTLRGNPTAGDTFTVQGTPAGPSPQNAGNAGAILALREKMFDDVPLADGYVSVISSLGTKIQAAKFAADFTSQVAVSTETARSSAAGVNLDEEAARLLQFQQSYQAAAKFLQIVQSNFDTLLQSVGR